MKSSSYRKRGSKNRQNKSAPILPPRLNLTPTLTHTFRYKCINGHKNLTIYAQDVLASLGGVGTGSTSIQPVASSAQIVRLRLYPAVAQTGSPDSISHNLSWSPEEGTSKDVLFDATYPNGVTIDKPITTRPVPKTLQSFWIDTSLSQGMFYTSAAQGSVLEITVRYTLAGAYGIPSARTTTGLTVLGSYYYPTLDVNTTGNWESCCNTHSIT